MMRRTSTWWLAGAALLAAGFPRLAVGQLGPAGSGFGGSGSPKPSANADLLPEVDPHIANDPEAVFEHAEKAYKDKDWLEAIAYYQHIRTKFSYNVALSAMAELRLGDIAYARERWAEARAFYHNFLRLHPRHEKADYAAFQLGMCAYRDIPSSFFFEPPASQRDQTEVRTALQVMQDFVRDYPSSSYVPEAKKIISSCEEKLADHEIYVAKFYESRQKWAGVVLRAENLARSYPNSKHTPEALVMAIDAHRRLNQIDEARKDLSLLIELNAPQKWIEKGRSALGSKNM